MLYGIWEDNPDTNPETAVISCLVNIPPLLGASVGGEMFTKSVSFNRTEDVKYPRVKRGY